MRFKNIYCESITKKGTVCGHYLGDLQLMGAYTVRMYCKSCNHLFEYSVYDSEIEKKIIFNKNKNHETNFTAVIQCQT